METATTALLQYRLESAKAIAWDSCHKIYILMADEQVEEMIGYGYGEYLHTSNELSPEEMYDRISEWYEDSCGLRFISAVFPNDHFEDIVPQEWE